MTKRLMILIGLAFVIAGMNACSEAKTYGEGTEQSNSKEVPPYEEDTDSDFLSDYDRDFRGSDSGTNDYQNTTTTNFYWITMNDLGYDQAIEQQAYCTMQIMNMVRIDQLLCVQARNGCEANFAQYYGFYPDTSGWCN